MDESIARRVFGWDMISPSQWEMQEIGAGTLKGPLPNFSTDGHDAYYIVRAFAGLQCQIQFDDDDKSTMTVRVFRKHPADPDAVTVKGTDHAMVFCKSAIKAIENGLIEDQYGGPLE